MAQNNFVGVHFIADPNTVGNQLKVNADGSIDVTSTVGSNRSVAAQGAPDPGYGTVGAWINGATVQETTLANPMPVQVPNGVSVSESVQNVVGSISSAAVLSNFPVNPTTGYRTACVQITNAGSGCTLVAEQSNDGTTWYGIQTPTDQTVQAATPMTAVGLYNFPVSALQFRVRCSVYGSGTPAVNVELRQTAIDYALQSFALGASSAVIGHVIVDSGAITANAGTNLNTSALALDATVSAFKTANHADLGTINTTLGLPFQAGGSIGNTAFIANAGTNLNTSLLALESGGNLATLAGGVSASVFQENIKQVNGVTVLTGTGATGTGCQRVTVAGDSATVAGSSSLPAGSNVIGHVIADAGSTTAVTQATASNLKAQVTGAGSAGSADAGVVTIQGIASMTKLLVTPDSVALPANQSVNVSQVNGTTVLVNTGAVGTGSQRVAVGTDTATVAGSAPGSAGSPNVFVGVSGAAASGASTVGNPLLSGARGATANPTAVTDGQAVALMADKLGKLVAVGAIRTLKGSQKTTISNSTAETTIVTQVASTFLDLYGLILANSGATTTKVDIRDTTSGTIIATIEVPTLETRGFMLPVDSAIPQTTVNTNWTAQCTSATTALEVTALFVKNT